MRAASATSSSVGARPSSAVRLRSAAHAFLHPLGQLDLLLLGQEGIAADFVEEQAHAVCARGGRTSLGARPAPGLYFLRRRLHLRLFHTSLRTLLVPNRTQRTARIFPQED